MKKIFLLCHYTFTFLLKINCYQLTVDRHSRLIELKFTLCINPTLIVVVRTSVWKHKFKGWKRRFDRYVLTLHAFNNWSIAFPDSVPFPHLSYQRLVKGYLQYVNPRERENQDLFNYQMFEKSDLYCCFFFWGWFGRSLPGSTRSLYWEE